MTNDDSSEDISTLLQAAISMHEMFTSLIAGGFTESQALYLVGITLRPLSEGV